MQRRWLFFAVLPALALLIAAGCGSDGDGGTNAGTRTEPAARARSSPTLPAGWRRVDGLRGDRYCEVLLLQIVDGELVADVWNTFGLNECPQDGWETLDADAIQQEYGVLAALLNGPRYWLMDAIEATGMEGRDQATFGPLEMFLAATVNLGPPPPDLTPYTEREVARDTVFEFAEGDEIYELVAPDGRVYVMQSYSAQSAELTADDLPGLGERINPPEGWTYRVRTLDETLRVVAIDATAVVVQDDFSNTYQLIASE